MQIRARMSMSVDGYVSTPGGWPALVADPAFVSGSSHGIKDFLVGVEAVVMGRTTFEPALNNERWAWPDLDVFVLASRRPPGTPDHVVLESDPKSLLERMRATNSGGDVHLVGGPATIEAFREIGALDKLEPVLLPILLGEDMRLTSGLSVDAQLSFERERALEGGAVEVVYAVGGSGGLRARDDDWAPASQRRAD
jgi:dihydrofolate reductase